ncbi:MAG TPA: hypothetical protein P5277_02030 [Candidatus Paceibacterota bacterium]|nr:hypothetical protein [Candidatus Paceibacterota bacterium]
MQRRIKRLRAISVRRDPKEPIECYETDKLMKTTIQSKFTRSLFYDFPYRLSYWDNILESHREMFEQYPNVERIVTKVDLHH